MYGASAGGKDGNDGDASSHQQQRSIFMWRRQRRKNSKIKGVFTHRAGSKGDSAVLGATQAWQLYSNALRASRYGAHVKKLQRLAASIT